MDMLLAFMNELWAQRPAVCDFYTEPQQDAAVTLSRSHHFIVQFLGLVAVPEESAS